MEFSNSMPRSNFIYDSPPKYAWGHGDLLLPNQPPGQVSRPTKFPVTNYTYLAGVFQHCNTLKRTHRTLENHARSSTYICRHPGFTPPASFPRLLLENTPEHDDYMRQPR